MPTPDNPVERLYRILETARSNTSKDEARYVLSSAMGIDYLNRATFLKGMAELLSLVGAAQESLTQLGLSHDPYLTPFKQIEEFFAVLDLRQPWDVCRLGLDD